MIHLCPTCSHIDHAGICGEMMIRVMSKRCGIGTYCKCDQRAGDPVHSKGGQHEEEDQGQAEGHQEARSQVTAAGAGVVHEAASAPGSSLPTQDPGIE